MMFKAEMKTRRPKRTSDQIKNELFKAITEIIREHGFPHLTVNNLSEKSTVSKDLIYRYYGSFEKLLEEYYNENDFWENFIGLVDDKYGNYEDFLKGIFKELFYTLDGNKNFQCVVRWELAVPNKFIKEKSREREEACFNFFEKNENKFADSSIDIRALYALFISGINYLVLHKDISAFCTLDLNTSTDKKRILNTIDQLVKMVFDYNFISTTGLNITQLRILKKLIERNYSLEEIANLLDVNVNLIEEYVSVNKL